MLFDFLNSKSHLFRGTFDEVKESLNIKIAHNFYVEYFINEFYTLYFDISVSVEDASLLIRHQHSHELYQLLVTQFTIEASPSFF